jgi:hypothetical protein
MGPSHAAKCGRRWRYYVSRAILTGRKPDAGSVTRVSAAHIEKQVFETINAVIASPRRSIDHASSHPATGKPYQQLFNYQDVLDAIERVTIGAEGIEIRLSDAVAVDGQDRTLAIPWTPPSPYQLREIIQREGEPFSSIRPMRVRARAVFVESLRHAHRWLDELVTDPNQTIETIAAREHKSECSIRMTLSLAFVARPSSPRPSKALCRAGSGPRD